MDVVSAGEPPVGEIPVPAGLAGLVTRIWWLRMPSPRPFERIVPLPAVHLVVNLSGPYRIVHRGAARLDLRLDGPFLSGIQSEHLHNENPAELRHVGAELAPWAPRAFGIDPAALAGRVLPAEPLLPGVDALATELRDRPTDAAAAGRLAELLLRLRRPGASPDARAVRAIESLAADPGRPISGLARELGLGANAVTALVRRSCGVTPKRFAELCRHHAFLAELPRDGVPRWGELVARGGYYDQPHFIREFRRFTGMTPGEFLARMRAAGVADPSFLPVDDDGAPAEARARGR